MKKIFVHFKNGKVGADIYVNPTQSELDVIHSSGSFLEDPNYSHLLSRGISPSYWELSENQIIETSKDNKDEIIKNIKQAKVIEIPDLDSIINEKIEKMSNKLGNEIINLDKRLNNIDEEVHNQKEINKSLNKIIEKQEENIESIHNEVLINNEVIKDIQESNEIFQKDFSDIYNRLDNVHKKLDKMVIRVEEIENQPRQEKIIEKVIQKEGDHIIVKEERKMSKLEKCLPIIYIALAIGASVIVHLFI